jgi:hypothetical protein
MVKIHTLNTGLKIQKKYPTWDTNMINDDDDDDDIKMDVKRLEL